MSISNTKQTVIKDLNGRYVPVNAEYVLQQLDLKSLIGISLKDIEILKQGIHKVNALMPDGIPKYNMKDCLVSPRYYLPEGTHTIVTYTKYHCGREFTCLDRLPDSGYKLLSDGPSQVVIALTDELQVRPNYTNHVVSSYDDWIITDKDGNEVVHILSASVYTNE